MEEKSLRVYSDKKFFTKLTNTITKLLIPTKIGINGMLISIKRNNVLKAYENYTNSENVEADKKDEVEKKYEDMFSLYLEAIDKHMMDNVYKKVKNDTATGFEREALSKYYMVIHLKDTEYLEYKYRKQIFLIQLDYDTVKELNKEKLTDRYEHFYASRMEALYKKLLKNYSIKLSDDLQPREKDEIYNKIFGTVEEYITDILPIKMKEEPDNKIYKEILSDYENFERFTVGKLDQNDVIEKNMILLGISRKLFTHSLPLVIAEQCYEKLLVDARTLIMDTKVIRKQEKAYGLLINIIDDYNLRLLSTKIYWDKPSDREEYKKFYAEYKNTVVIGQTLSEVKQKLADLGAPKSTPTPHIKGWGEISQQLLKSLVVDKSTRKLIRIKPITDNDRVTFVRVMNEDVAFRRQMLGLSDSV